MPCFPILFCEVSLLGIDFPFGGSGILGETFSSTFYRLPDPVRSLF
jgi:hypothetical protein